MSRPPTALRKVGRVLACLPEPKTTAWNSVRGFPEQRQANNADAAGFPWSGGRAVSKVGCDVWHGVPKIRKSQSEVGSSGNLGTATCSSHAGLRREAETERNCIKLMLQKLMSCEAEGNEDEKAKRVCCGVVVLF